MLDLHPIACLLALSSTYFARTLAYSIQKPLWFDELFTFHISRMQTFAEASASASTADLHPPLSYVLTSICHTLLGPTEIATRLPQTVAFWVMCLCLFQLVRSRAGIVYGFLAFCLPLVSGAYQYSYEARPYGMVLGFAGLALLSWRRASGTKRKAGWLVLLTLALAGGALSHHFALFQVAMPILIGESVRVLVRRKADWPMAVALAVGLLPLLWTYPLARASAATFDYVQQSQNFWARPTLSSILHFYQELLVPLLPLIVALAFTSLLVRRSHEPGPSLPQTCFDWPFEERAAVFGFLAVPVVVVVATMLTTGYFLNRYCMSALIGFVIAFCFWTATTSGRRAGVAVLVAVLGWILADLPRRILPVVRSDRSALTFRPPRPAEADDLPIVISNPIAYLQAAHYTQAAERGRLHYLTDRATVLRKPDFLPELGLARGAAWLPGTITPYREFLRNHDRFWLLSHGQTRIEWHAEKLLEDGWNVELRDIHGRSLFLVSRGARP